MTTEEQSLNLSVVIRQFGFPAHCCWLPHEIFTLQHFYLSVLYMMSMSYHSKMEFCVVLCSHGRQILEPGLFYY